jgi:hypothetical protein
MRKGGGIKALESSTYFIAYYQRSDGILDINEAAQIRRDIGTLILSFEE